MTKIHALIAILFAANITTSIVLEDEIDDRIKGNSILDDRLAQAESYLVGHKVILGKKGSAITLEPCDLGEADCIPDNKGIIIKNSSFNGWYNGINVKSGVMLKQAIIKNDIFNSKQ